MVRIGVITPRILIAVALIVLAGGAMAYWGLSPQPLAIPEDSPRSSEEGGVEEKPSPLTAVETEGGYRQMAPRFN